MTPPAPPALTAAEERELDALLGKLLLPSFTPREVEIASATARAVLAHVRAALAAPPPDAVQPPPADAKEWTCRQCGGDVLWCKCPAPPDAGLVALVREAISAVLCVMEPSVATLRTLSDSGDVSDWIRADVYALESGLKMLRALLASPAEPTP